VVGKKLPPAINSNKSSSQLSAINESNHVTSSSDQQPRLNENLNQAPGLPPVASGVKDKDVNSEEAAKNNTNGDDVSNNDLLLDNEDSSSNHDRDHLMKLQVLKDIESLKPDYEQRQLAIEVKIISFIRPKNVLDL
jgi:hypothetical protein